MNNQELLSLVKNYAAQLRSFELCKGTAGKLMNIAVASARLAVAREITLASAGVKFADVELAEYEGFQMAEEFELNNH